MEVLGQLMEEVKAATKELVNIGNSEVAKFAKKLTYNFPHFYYLFDRH